MTGDDTQRAFTAAGDSLEHTDGLVIAVLMVRQGEGGGLEIHTPTIPTALVSADVVAAIAQQYAMAATEVANGSQEPTPEHPLERAFTIGRSLRPMPMRGGKHTVN